VNEIDLCSEDLVRLRETLLDHPGPCAVWLHVLQSGKGETVIELSEQVRVNPNRDFEDAVAGRFGDRVRFHAAQS
jgi:hypothetical protein